MKLFSILDGYVSDLDFHNDRAELEEKLQDLDQIERYAEFGLQMDISEEEALKISKAGLKWIASVNEGGEWSHYRHEAINALSEE